MTPNELREYKRRSLAECRRVKGPGVCWESGCTFPVFDGRRRCRKHLGEQARQARERKDRK